MAKVDQHSLRRIYTHIPAFLCDITKPQSHSIRSSSTQLLFGGHPMATPLCNTQPLITVAEKKYSASGVNFISFTDEEVFTVATQKNSMTDSSHLLRQRKTSQQNAIFSHQWHSVSRWCWQSACCHFLATSVWYSSNQGYRSLLLWGASVTTVTACLWRFHLTTIRQCSSAQGINISQGSVAIHSRCGGIFNDHFTENLLWLFLWKNFEKNQYLSILVFNSNCDLMSHHFAYSGVNSAVNLSRHPVKLNAFANGGFSMRFIARKTSPVKLVAIYHPTDLPSRSLTARQKNNA